MDAVTRLSQASKSDKSATRSNDLAIDALKQSKATEEANSFIKGLTDRSENFNKPVGVQ